MHSENQLFDKRFVLSCFACAVFFVLVFSRSSRPTRHFVPETFFAGNGMHKLNNPDVLTTSPPQIADESVEVIDDSGGHEYEANYEKAAIEEELSDEPTDSTVFNRGAIDKPDFAWWKPLRMHEPGLGPPTHYNKSLDGKVSPQYAVVNTVLEHQNWVNYCVDSNALDGGEQLNATFAKYANMKAVLGSQVKQGMFVPSTGRVGSKLLIGTIRKGAEKHDRFYIHHTHNWAHSYKRTTLQKAILVFGDPIGVILSLHQKVNEYGCEGATRWISRHADNLSAKVHWKKQLHEAKYTHNCTTWVNTMMKEDVMRLERHVEGYHQTQNYPLLTVKYESEHRAHVADSIKLFTGSNNFKGFPSRNQKVSGSMSHVPRSERWSKLQPHEREWLTATYGKSQARVLAAPDVCFWPPVLKAMKKPGLMSNLKINAIPVH